jgi:hypothetical protein
VTRIPLQRSRSAARCPRCPRRRPRVFAWPPVLTLAVVLAALAAAAGPAAAGVPDPRNCVADTCLVLSPGGAFVYSVLLRDESMAPIVGATVVLDFATAPGIALCDSSDPDHDGRVMAVSNAAGSVEFRVRGGGQTTGYVVAGALGQTVRIVYPRSPDLSGNLTVGAEDAALHAALPSSARAGDYDCDGDSDAADRAQITLEMGQDCGTVNVLSCTWGRVKGLYR